MDGPGLAPGRKLAAYRIERCLGRGGMGVVYLARDSRLHRFVALKIVENPSDDPADAAGRLLREARSAAALSHPGICTIHEVGEADGTAFIAMEYVEGRSLREWLDEGRTFDWREAVRWSVQAADALAYAHDRGVIHRDFKAANVIVAGDGRLKIVDFGLARRSDVQLSGAATTETAIPAGVLAGTPYAMAPEQLRGDAADARTDIWALGVLLYELACSRKPFEGATAAELYSQILRDQPAPLPHGVPEALRRVIEGCLRKLPSARYRALATFVWTCRRSSRPAARMAQNRRHPRGRCRRWFRRSSGLPCCRS